MTSAAAESLPILNELAAPDEPIINANADIAGTFNAADAETRAILQARA